MFKSWTTGGTEKIGKSLRQGADFSGYYLASQPKLEVPVSFRARTFGLSGGSFARRMHLKRGGTICRTHAFTLIELLVGFAVLALLVTVLAAAFSNFSQVASTSNRRMEINKQAQALFDRMGFDITSAIQNGGVRMQFLKDMTLPNRGASKNDAIIMLTDAKSPDATSRLANVGYAVEPYENSPRNMNVDTVHRYIQAQRWQDDTTTIDISLGKDGAPDIDVQPIAPGIVRFELAFAMKDGTIRANPPPSGSSEEVLAEFYDNLGSVIVTVATLDEDSLQKLSSTERESITNNLNDAVDSTSGRETPLTVWQAVSFDGMPVVQQGLRFHQRYFRVN